MTANGRCDYPGCQNITGNYSTHFKKWECDEHSLGKVVWPKPDEMEPHYVDHSGTVKKVGHKHPTKNSKWGKKYF